ncbi:hypothetical protein T265_00301 [Opisthorchis viverrini]|uniref:Uncharacterized protein n=1 Tax=Opisthorchis viverrini TaxID=6198 RepID=A0A075A2A7_OPIVI|nr:hypothetical protein T265_00301 [Opisthorchis viverrini]KER33853.1 hypothetical protein T265_00301 [Opisthorchis viverrini]
MNLLPFWSRIQSPEAPVNINSFESVNRHVNFSIRHHAFDNTSHQTRIPPQNHEPRSNKRTIADDLAGLDEKVCKSTEKKEDKKRKDAWEM